MQETADVAAQRAVAAMEGTFDRVHIRAKKRSGTTGIPPTRSAPEGRAEETAGLRSFSRRLRGARVFGLVPVVPLRSTTG